MVANWHSGAALLLLAGPLFAIELPVPNTTLNLTCFGWRLVQPELIITADGALYRGNAISDSELRAITAVNTDLIIADDKFLTNLSNLAGIRRVGGNVEIRYNPSLVDLAGLDNISSIGGNLTIINNHGLRDLNGLVSLKVIGEDLKIEHNHALSHVSGLSELSRIGRDLLVTGNKRLISAPSLQSLTVVDRDMEFNFNEAMTSTSEMTRNLQRVGRDIIMADNDRLAELDALPKLTQIGGRLHVNYHQRLERISGLNQLISVGGVMIKSNPRLQRVDGFASLRTIHLGGLAVSKNSKLELVNLPALRTVQSEVSVTDNRRLAVLGLPRLSSVAGAFNFSDNDAVESLELPDLTHVSGGFKLTWSLSLVNLSSNVGHLGGDVLIRNNAALERIALPKLASINGSLGIMFNLQMRDMVSSNLRFIASDVLIKNNAALRQINMNSLHSMSGGLEVSFNQNLREIASSALGIGGNAAIRNNAALQHLAMPNLGNVDGDMEISFNHALPNICNFGKLALVAGHVRIIQNHGMAKLELSSLLQISGDLEIRNNSALRDLLVFSKALTIDGDLRISANERLQGVSGITELPSVGRDVVLSLNCPKDSVQLPSEVQCTPCRLWEEQAEDRARCQPRYLHLVIIGAFAAIVMIVSTITLTCLRRAMVIDSVTMMSGVVVLKTCERHYLLPWPCKSFPLHLKGTGCPHFDEAVLPLHARVLSDTELQLLLDIGHPAFKRCKQSMSSLALPHGPVGSARSVRLMDSWNSLESDMPDAGLSACDGMVRLCFGYEFLASGFLVPVSAWLTLLLGAAATLIVAAYYWGVSLVLVADATGLSLLVGTALALSFRITAHVRRQQRMRRRKTQKLEKALLQDFEEACWGSDEEALAKVKARLGDLGWTENRFQQSLHATKKRQSEEAGVSVAYLLSEEFLTLTQTRSQMQDPNFYDLKDAFFFCHSNMQPIGVDAVCPRDGLPGCALVDTLPWQHRRACTHFLSWTWSYSVGQVRSAMEVWVEQCSLNAAQTFLYMCFFANNQFRILVDKTGSGSDNLEELFEANLRRIGRMVALVDSWDQPVYLSRIWTIFEQFTAVVLGIEVHMILPQASGESLLNEIRKGEEGIILVKQSLCTVDAENAKAWLLEDELKVKQKITDTTGFETVNAKVREFMIAWVAQMVQDYLGALVIGSSRRLQRLHANTALLSISKTSSLKTRLSSQTDLARIPTGPSSYTVMTIKASRQGQSVWSGYLRRE